MPPLSSASEVGSGLGLGAQGETPGPRRESLLWFWQRKNPHTSLGVLQVGMFLCTPEGWRQVRLSHGVPDMLWARPPDAESLLGRCK